MNAKSKIIMIFGMNRVNT